MSDLEDRLALQMRAAKLPEPVREYRFAAHATGGTGPGCRQRLKAAKLADWRFDFAWPDQKFAVEVEGGAFVGGRHTRGAGFEADLKKYSAAMRHGWTVYRCSGSLIKSGEALEMIQLMLDRSANE